MADGNIVYEVDLDSKDAVSSATELDKKATGLGKNFKTAAKVGAAAMIGIGASILGTTKKVSATADNIDKMSQKLGLSTQGYQEWDYILSQSGVSIDSMSMGMKTMTGLVESGSDAFDTLGVSTKNADGSFRNQEDIFADSVTALQSMEDGVKKTALAQEVFGRSGQDLIPLLNGTAESTEKLKNKANDLGLVLDDSTIAAGVNMTDSMDTLERSFGAVFTQLGAALLPTMLQLSDWLTNDGIPALIGFLDQLKAAPAFIEENSTMLELIGVAIATVTALVIAYNIQQALATAGTTLWGAVAGVATGITTGLGVAFAFLTSPIGLVILAIGAVIAIGILLYKNWDTIKAKAGELGSAVASKFNAIKSSISATINGAVSIIKSAVDKIKSIFNFKWSFPKLKMPHFSIGGSFSLMPPSVPHLNVDWYAKGGVMTKPTMFGMNGNRPMVGGEAGAEAIAPISTLQSYIRDAVGNTGSYGPSQTITVNLNNVTNLDGQTIASNQMPYIYDLVMAGGGGR